MNYRCHPMRFILLHHRFGGYGSHHFNEARGFRIELARRGKKLLLFVTARADRRVIAELEGRPVLDDPTFRLEWSFEERTRRFVDMLHAHIDRVVRADDCVMLTIATQLETHALARWLRELPARKRPWIVVVFLSDRWNRAGREEYERQIAEFAVLRETLASLAPGDAQRMIFFALTPPLTEEMTELLGTRVIQAPIPLPYGPAPRSTPSAIPRIAILGGTRRDKGSHLIPDIIRACRSQVEVEFVVHLSNDALAPDEVAQLERIAKEPNVTVIPSALPPAEYEAALANADLGLFPYEAIPYRKRTSGVFAEMIACGKPGVVTPGTWLAEQIESGRAAGIVTDDLQPESIARAIARCVAELEPLTRAAQAKSDAWRKTQSLPAFVDLVEQELARRALSCGAGFPARAPGGRLENLPHTARKLIRDFLLRVRGS
jgi:glycosyltransferase involved in cell wall biosynthesis